MDLKQEHGDKIDASITLFDLIINSSKIFLIISLISLLNDDGEKCLNVYIIDFFHI